jgi:hypothetical protein
LDTQRTHQGQYQMTRDQLQCLHLLGVCLLLLTFLDSTVFKMKLFSLPTQDVKRTRIHFTLMESFHKWKKHLNLVHSSPSSLKCHTLSSFPWLPSLCSGTFFHGTLHLLHTQCGRMDVSFACLASVSATGLCAHWGYRPCMPIMKHSTGQHSNHSITVVLERIDASHMHSPQRCSFCDTRKRCSYCYHETCCWNTYRFIIMKLLNRWAKGMISDMVSF